MKAIRNSGAFLSLLLMLSFLTAIPARADSSGPGLDTALVDSNAEVYGSEVTNHTKHDQLIAHPSSASVRVRMLRAYVPACEGNWPGADSAGVLCERATTMCLATPDPNDLGFWVFTAPAGPPAPTHSSWHATGEYACRSAADANDPATVEPVVTVEDFRRLPLPAAAIEVQPPTRRTLINIPTNLYAGVKTVILPTTVLGQAVRVRAKPLRFRWTYGDGTALTTIDPGGPYPVLRTAHTYRLPGNRTLDLVTTYSGEYSVDGGAWEPIDGVATVASAPTDLTVLSAENHLVAEPVS